MEEKTIVLAGGCFWGMEKLYRGLDGVTEVTAGYANGRAAEYANYHDVCTGISGFREAVEIRYDPSRITLKHLLFVFYAVIDPTQWHRQGMDMGSQYQTGIYWSDAADEDTVRSVSAQEAQGLREFYVEQKPLESFYPAEDYHQRYLDKNPGGYCHINPKRMAAVAAYPYRDEAYTQAAKTLLGF